MSAPATTLHWCSTWPGDGTAPALAALEDEGPRVIAWHRPGATAPPELDTRAFEVGSEVWRALNEGVAVLDLRGATEHAWIAELAASVPGIVLLAAPAWHALTLALPGGLAARLHILHEEHGAAGLEGGGDLRRGARSGGDLDVELPLAGWVARRSLAVLADLDDPRCAVRVELRVPVHALPSDPQEVVRAVAALADQAGSLRRRAAANLAADAVGAVVRRWVVTPRSAEAVFERGTAAVQSLYGADA